MAGQIIEKGKNKFLVRMFLGRDENGTRVYHNKTIHGNKKAAQAYLNKILREKDIGEFTEPSNELLSKYLEIWLEKVVKQRVAASTFQSYKDYVSCYLKPGLGNKIISKLKPIEIQDFYNSMLAQGLSPRTVRYTHAILRNALNQAVKWDHINRNPAEMVDLPRSNKAEMTVLTPEEAARFMEATITSEWQAFFSLLLASGMRPGEALGLKWADIDFEKNRVHVQRALSRTKEGWRLEEPKTPQSKRSIPLPKGVMKDLKEHRKKQVAKKLKNKKYVDHGLVFTGKNGEPPDYRHIFDKHFKPLLKAAELPDIRLYDLRHTCATLLLSEGENPKIVSERLGHASVTMTLDTYSHVLPDMQEKAAAKLEELLFTKPGKKNKSLAHHRHTK